MQKLLLLGSLCLGLSAHGQTTLFQDNFEAGGGNWTLNGGTGTNLWIVNSEYVDGSGIDIVAQTPDEPAGTSGGVNSAYLHIHSSDFCTAIGACNAGFYTGSVSNQSATQTSPIVTTSYTNVTLEFIYLCVGATGSAYGIVEYSTDGGTIWTAASSQYSLVTSWTNASITLPAFNNQASLKFRFRWQNGATGDDAPFSIDEVKITGTTGSAPAVGTGAITATTYCSNTTTPISVPFTVTGTVTSGNTYTAQLSNSSGSFAASTTIGTLASTATGTLSISATIPSGLTPGTGYRIRVNASNPVTTGTDNGTNLVVAAAPAVSVTSVPANGIICTGQSAALTASGGATFVWSPAGSLSSSTGQNVSATPGATQIYTIIGTGANGCLDTASFTLTVQTCMGLEEESFGDFELYPNPVNHLLNLNFGELKDIQGLTVLDLAGRKVLSATAASSELEVSSLESGKYFLLIEHAAGVSVKAFVKE